MKKSELKAVDEVEQLRKIFNLFEIQGFKTPQEMFFVGYLVAHGGEKLFLTMTENDLTFLEENAEFWLPIVKDELRIRRKVHDADIERAKTILRQLFKERDAKLPSWLKE